MPKAAAKEKAPAKEKAAKKEKAPAKEKKEKKEKKAKDPNAPKKNMVRRVLRHCQHWVLLAPSACEQL
jgi:hypothetical protein